MSSTYKSLDRPRTYKSLDRLSINCGTKRSASTHPRDRRALQGADRNVCLAAYIVSCLALVGLTVAPVVMGGFIGDAFSHAILWIVTSAMMLFFMIMLCVGCD